MGFINVLFLLLCGLLIVSSEKFYKVFNNDNSTEIRGIANGEPILAIATESYIIFGKIGDDFNFTETGKAELSKDLRGNNELLEFKFIKNDTVIVCNSKECSICINSDNSSDTCTTIAAFPIRSVNLHATEQMLFLRVVHETNNAALYSFKFQNGTYEQIGKKFDRITDNKEMKSLYAFLHINHIYFVNQIKRTDPALCIKENNNSSRMNNDIVITQICDNDVSNDIVSHMEITVSCGKSKKHNTSFNTILRDIHQNNVTGVTYLPSLDKLVFVIQDSTMLSAMCEFDMSKIEAEFCKTWNFCKHKEAYNLNKKRCNGEIQDTGVCFKYLNAYGSACEFSSKESYCDERTTMTKQRIFKSAESYTTIFGKIIGDMSYNEPYGTLVSTSNHIYVQRKSKLLKIDVEQTFMDKDATFKYKNGSYYYLGGLPVNDLRMFTPWESKNGIIYVDPETRNTIYFKDVICDRLDCFDILHTTNVKCSFCEKSDVLHWPPVCKALYNKKIYCGPLWQKVNASQSVAYVTPLAVTDIQHFLITINGVEKIVYCMPDTQKQFDNCINVIDGYLAPYFTATFPANYSFEYLSPVSNIITLSESFILYIAAILILFVATAISATLLSVRYRHKKDLRINEDVHETLLLNDINYPYMNALIDEEKISIIRKIGEGHYGEVFLATYTEENETKMVAVKMLKCERSDVIKEIKSLSACKHANIVSFIGWTETAKDMRIITEYMNGKDLQSYLKNPQNLFMLSTFFSYIFQIMDAMIYLSDNKITHRDLATRNCLLNETKEVVKISDFGLARKLNVNYEYLPEKGRELPFRWLPIEALRNEPFTVKGDIWSFAVLIWEMFERGNQPYKNLPLNEYPPTALFDFLNSGNRLSCPEQCPEELYEIMKNCWKEIPEERPTFRMLQKEIKKLFEQLKTRPNKNQHTNALNEYVNYVYCNE